MSEGLTYTTTTLKFNRPSWLAYLWLIPISAFLFIFQQGINAYAFYYNALISYKSLSRGVDSYFTISRGTDSWYTIGIWNTDAWQLPSVDNYTGLSPMVKVAPTLVFIFLLFAGVYLMIHGVRNSNRVAVVSSLCMFGVAFLIFPMVLSGADAILNGGW